jgi:3-phenylpropionate/trans-cinnamate dioxygenase ferredoxin subunit
MPEVRIRALKNGPYEISGGPTVVDAEGAPRALDEDPIYLCRCGQSTSKPFCDGTHKKVGFQADGWVRVSSSR